MKSIRRATCPTCKYNTDTALVKLKCPKDGTPMKLSSQWYARGQINGKAIFQPCGPLKKDADAFIATCLLAKRSGSVIPGQEKDIPWADAVANCNGWWDKEVERGKMRPATRSYYGNQITVLDRYFNGASLLTITKAATESMMDNLTQTHSPASVAHAVKTLKRVYAMHMKNLDLEECARPKLIEKAFIIGQIDPPVVDNEITACSDAVDVHAVLAAIESGRSRPIDKQRIRLAMSFGMGMLLRPHNICSLLWSDIDLANGILTIDKGRMKGKKSVQMPIPAQILQELKAWRIKCGFASKYLFPSPGDATKPMQSMQRALTNWIRKTGLNPAEVKRSGKVTPYVLCKHSGASALMELSGDNLEMVAQTANHTTSKVTRRYVKARIEHKKITAIPLQEAVLAWLMG